MKIILELSVLTIVYLIMAGAACFVRARAEPQLHQWERDRNGSHALSHTYSYAWPGILFGYGAFWFYALPALGCYWIAMRAREQSTQRFRERRIIEREIEQIEEQL